MRVLMVVLCFLSLSAAAMDPVAFLSTVDNKIYSLKTKGVKDFTVEIVSPKLTKQMNDQQIFGKVPSLSFKLYWTANPERAAIEIQGLPEGFKEAKEELKLSLLPVIEYLLPPTFAQKFNGYKFSFGKDGKNIVATDTGGLAPVPSYDLTFDQDRLTEVKANLTIGTSVTSPVYIKTNFSDGRWVLSKSVTINTENGQTLTSTKKFDYGQVEGIGVLKSLNVKTEQKAAKNTSTVEENLEFRDYKINTGEAMKYFLGEAH